MVVVLAFIFLKIILPLFVLIAVGFVAQRTMRMDSRTFSRMTIYIFVPAVLFTKMYSAKVDLRFFATIILFVSIIQILMFVIGEVTARSLGYSRGKRKAFSNALTFFNSGNYGLPLADLVFKSSPMAASVQVFIMILQNTTGNTLGVFQASSANSSYKKSLGHIFRMPSLSVAGPRVQIIFVLRILTSFSNAEASCRLTEHYYIYSIYYTLRGEKSHYKYATDPQFRRFGVRRPYPEVRRR